MRELDPKGWREQQERPRREALHARRLVALWNLRVRLKRKATFFPTIGTALAARRPVLDVICPGCQTIGRVDLRRVDMHPNAPISALIPRLSCRRCCLNPPFAVLGELAPAPDERP